MSKTRELSIEKMSQIEGRFAVAFVAAHAGVGCTTAILSTAGTLSHNLGAKVLVVDANVRQPSLHRLFGLPPSPGLADLLEAGGNGIVSAIHSGQEPFDLLTAGRETSLAHKTLNPDAIRAFLAAMRSRYDYVLFDMCPLDEMPLAGGLFPVFDGVVMVIACEATRWEVAQNMKEKLQAAQAPLAGVILNRRKYYIPRALYRFV